MPTNSVGRTYWKHKERTDVHVQQDVGQTVQLSELPVETEESVIEDADDIG